jgi:ATP-dependent Clp protease ATP-binding subunit ClpB
MQWFLNIYPERARLDRIKDLKKQLEDAKHEFEVAQRHGQYDKASQLRFGTIPELERQLPRDSEMKDDAEESPLSMLHDRVTSNDIARVVAKATGIPVQNLLKGERDKLVHVRLTTSLYLNRQQLLIDGGCPQRTSCWPRSCCRCD